VQIINYILFTKHKMNERKQQLREQTASMAVTLKALKLELQQK
jgi:hypothetical protein